MFRLQRLLRPTHESVLIRKDLVIASSVRKTSLSIRVIVGGNYPRGHRRAGFIKFDEEAARERMGGRIVAQALGVVEDGDGAVGRITIAVANVVLTGEPDARE